MEFLPGQSLPASSGKMRSAGSKTGAQRDREKTLFGLPDPVGNVVGQDDGELHETGVLLSVVPGCLEDQLLEPFFLNGIDIGARILQHVGEKGPGRLRMAVQDILTDQFCLSGL